MEVVTLEEGRAILTAENAPGVENLSLDLNASEALTSSEGSFSVAGALVDGGQFAHAEHVEVINIDTAAKALVASKNSAVDQYSLATDFTGGTVSVEEAIAILAAKNADAVTGKESFILKIQDSNDKIKSAIENSDGLEALQVADEVLAIGASKTDAVEVAKTGSASNSYGALVDKVTAVDFGENPKFIVEEYLALTNSAIVTNPIPNDSMVEDEIGLIVAKEGQLQNANVHALNVGSLDQIKALDGTSNAVDSWQAKTKDDGSLDAGLAADLEGISVAEFAAVEKLPAKNQSLLIAETSVTDSVTAITNSFSDNSSPLTKLGKSDVVAIDATVTDAVAFAKGEGPVAAVANSFRLAENSNGDFDLEKIGFSNNNNGSVGDIGLSVEAAKAVILAVNKPDLSDLSVSDNADKIEDAIQESFLSTVGSVHATGASVAQAGEFIDTGYVNSITLNGSTFEDLRVREAEIVTNDKIVSNVSSYDILDLLANITVAPPALLANADGYEVATDIAGVLNLDEALAWKGSDLYGADIAASTQFSIVDSADKILAATSDPEARIVMGDATSVKAEGGVVSVAGSNSLQGLSFFDANISSYAIEDTASALIANSTSKALENLDVDGVATIKLVDPGNPSANAVNGASLNAIKAGLSDDGPTMTFTVKDTAAALVQNEAKLDLANDVSVGGDGDNDLTVAEAGQTDWHRRNLTIRRASLSVTMQRLLQGLAMGSSWCFRLCHRDRFCECGPGCAHHS